MDPAVAHFKITGLSAATLTPYAAEGGIDLALVPGMAADLVKHGVKAVFITGTTGDSFDLSVGEHEALTREWVKVGKPLGIQVVAHIGANSVTDVKEMARYCAAAGVDAIAVNPPTFFKPAGPRGAAEWLKMVGAEAPSLPLYFYHFPLVTGFDVNPHALIQEVEAIGVPTFRGFKFTEYNVAHYSICTRHGGGRYDVVYGRDDAMLGALALGCTGVIGNQFLFAAGLFHRLVAAFERGDLASARIEQGRACDMLELMYLPKWGRSAGLPVCRAIVELKGVACGPCRMPLVTLPPDQVAVLRADLEAMGFFSWCD